MTTSRTPRSFRTDVLPEVALGAALWDEQDAFKLKVGSFIAERF